MPDTRTYILPERLLIRHGQISDQETRALLVEAIGEIERLRETLQDIAEGADDPPSVARAVLFEKL